MCLTWAVACVERVLPLFDAEFHQDTRHRQRFGAAMLLLREGDPQALQLCGAVRGTVDAAGCRILHRGLWERVRDPSSPGERAMHAVGRLTQAAVASVEPRGLWAVYPAGDIANGYETPQNRCLWNLPWWQAEQVAFDAAQATGNRKQEFQWQRETLARLILTWPTWHEDRSAWQSRVDGEWVPKVLQVLEAVVAQAQPPWTSAIHFNVPAYAERIRREFVPWRVAGGDQPAAGPSSSGADSAQTRGPFGGNT